MISARFFIDPIPKGRPRFSRRSGVVYTPQETRAYENAVKVVGKMHVEKAEISPLIGPLEVNIHFYLTKPKTSKNKYPSVKPDLDNFEKAVLDSLNDIFWKDDAQICSKTSTKSYVHTTGYFTLDVRELK